VAGVFGMYIFKCHVRSYQENIIRVK